jgi:tetratricopeptide (TPR) repeat protein
MKSSRQLTLFLVLLLSASLLPSCNRDPNVRKQKAMDRGNREFDQGKYPEAIIYYGQVLQIDTHDAAAHYKLAQCHIKLGSWTSAFRELARTVELQPENWPAQLQLAEMSLRAGQAQEAKDRALLILRSNPNHADAQVVLSAADAALNDSKSALREAQEATRMAPDRPEPYLHLSVLQARSGDLTQAESSLKKASSLDSTTITSFMTLGNFYEQQHRWAEAAAQFQSAITRAPKSPGPRAALATVYLNQGQDSLAEKILVEAKEQLPDDPAAYRMLGDYYLGREENAKALAEFSSLVTQHPKDIQVRKTYIQLLVLNHRIDEASSLDDEVIKKAPQDADALALRGEIQLLQGKVDDSIKTLQSALHIFSDNAFAHYQLGRALQKKGNAQQGETELREAVRLNPSLAEAWRALGEGAIRRADWPGLHNIAVQLKKIAPRSPEGYLFDATARANQNDAASAEADLTQLVTLAPNNALGYVKLGQLRLAQKRLNEAESYYRQGLSRDPNSLEALRGLVELNFRRNKPAEALRLIQTQLDANPNSSPLNLMQAQALLQNKQSAEAEHALERAVQLDKQNLNAVTLLAELQDARGARDQALATYQHAIELSPNNASLHVALGTLQEASGNWQLAQSTYQKALLLQPEHPLASNNLAYIMLEHGGSANLALNLAQAARRGLPNSPNIADTLGWAYYKNSAFSVAAPLFEEAVKKVPDNAAYRYHLGLTYQKLNDKDRARAQFEKVIGMDPKSSTADQARSALGQLAGG